MGEQRRLGLRGCLQEGARGREDLRPAEGLRGCVQSHDRLAVPHQPREVVDLREGGQFDFQRGGEGPVRLDRHVGANAAVRDGEGHFGFAAGGDFGERLQRRDQCGERREQQLAVGHRDERVRGAGVKADHRRLFGPPTGEPRPPPGLRGGGVDARDLGCEPLPVSARATMSVFHAATNASEACCTAQPPQVL
jgi:hypothetical protein